MKNQPFWMGAMRLGFGLAVLLLLALPPAARATNIYHIGNSVTDTINYTGLQHLAESRGNTDNWGRHMIPGAPLEWIWDHPADGFNQSPYGYYPNALPNYTWDILTLQPFDRHLASDVDYVTRYVNLALQNAANKNAQVYIYSRWPRKDSNGNLNFNQQWDKTYTGGWDGTEETRDYFQDLTNTLNASGLGLNKPLLMVPVGDVLYELNNRMHLGQVPGYTDITQIYADGIHFGNVGQFIVGTTFYATLFKDNPLGMTVPGDYNTFTTAQHDGNPTAYQTVTPAMAAIFQDAVWDVVSTHPYAGVVPEPGSALLLALGGAAGLIRRRKGKQHK